jgi:acyl carrier protein
MNEADETGVSPCGCAPLIVKDLAMEDAKIYDKLTAVFRDVFDEDDLVLGPGTTADEVDGWDSLAHIRLVLAVSKAFGVKFSASEIGGLKNVGEFVEVIRTKT